MSDDFDRDAGGDVDRGQTTIDYAIGVSVFLLVVAFVFAFSPSLTAPFTGDATDAVVVADRSADRLANDLLVADPARPAALDAACTAGFFDTTEPVGDCRYETDASDLTGALGIGSPVRTANVTLVDGDEIRTLGDGGNAVRLAAGPSPPRGADVSVARRAVLLDGSDAIVVVRVW
ncbi:hypothetical protein Hbl1158_08035 [Halobaculum sp. CBA1158]|uniref:DUF7287 family protein n=1 Tax=Halobaculum sp. CBA1158 TaxID=2904243 RepID=UPI001F467963|nr:hypothetical protein [Halobaculum sp. CBA1158]UIO98513.1 hypothetical protein Hbl1158_08035 [Halobaculum sp. CBA1158]